MFGALAARMAGANLHAFRHAIDRVPPSEYLVGYYEPLARRAETMLVDSGVVTTRKRRGPRRPADAGRTPPSPAPARAAQAADALAAVPATCARRHAARVRGRGPGPGRRPATPCRPHPAAQIRAAADRDGDRHPARPGLPGHRRALRRARTRSTCYAVEFDSRELWGADAEPFGLPSTFTSAIWSPRHDRPRPRHPDPALRAEALASLLAERGLIDEATVETLHQDLRAIGRADERRQGGGQGLDRSRVPGPAAGGRRPPRSPSSGSRGRRASTSWCWRTRPTVHHVVVCTLCSCYPWPVLGLPPSWYKDPAYRSRVVREPRRGARASSGWISTTTWRSGSGTPAPRSATWCCRSARPGPRTPPRRSSRPGHQGRHGRRGEGGRPVTGRAGPPGRVTPEGMPTPPTCLMRTAWPRRHATTANWCSRPRGRAGPSGSRSRWRCRAHRLGGLPPGADRARSAAWEAAHPSGEGWSYYECWLRSLERVVAGQGLVGGDDRRPSGPAAVRPGAGHDHDEAGITTDVHIRQRRPAGDEFGDRPVGGRLALPGRGGRVRPCGGRA